MNVSPKISHADLSPETPEKDLRKRDVSTRGFTTTLGIEHPFGAKNPEELFPYVAGVIIYFMLF